MATAEVVFGHMHQYAYTNGAFIRPVSIDGRWMWVVEHFEDDSFIDGECRNFNETADTEKELVDPEFEDIEDRVGDKPWDYV